VTNGNLYNDSFCEYISNSEGCCGSDIGFNDMDIDKRDMRKYLQVRTMPPIDQNRPLEKPRLCLRVLQKSMLGSKSFWSS
jgi:hypothetical protein